MASIFKRENKNGTFSWRVQIRRKGLKTFVTSFSSKKDAETFVSENEEKYCLDPENFNWDHLRNKREREFARKNN